MHSLERPGGIRKVGGGIRRWDKKGGRMDKKVGGGIRKEGGWIRRWEVG